MLRSLRFFNPNTHGRRQGEGQVGFHGVMWGIIGVNIGFRRFDWGVLGAIDSALVLVSWSASDHVHR